jgi:anaerobic magnesium-protoporphyrin IX monomethyl ester cyclase
VSRDPGTVLLLTGGLLTSQERSLGEVLRKLVPQFLHSRHGWLDLKIKAVGAEPLLAWRKVLGTKLEGVRLEARLDLEAGRSSDAAPSLTETVLAGSLESSGLRVECLPLADVFTGGTRFARALARARCVWISTTYLHDLSELEPILRRVRGRGRRIVMGGALTGSLKADWPGHPDVDLVVVGYGEYAAPFVAKWQIGGFEKLEAPEGGRIETREHGRFLFAGSPKGQSLDDLPRPDWEATFRRAGRRFPRISYESVRGCPYRCAFCNYPYLFDDNRFRYRSADTILADWVHYARDLGVRRIECLDSLFTMPPKRLIALCEGLERENMGLSWSCYARADDLCEPELVAAMVRAGATHVQIGVESGDQGQLDRMAKRCTVDKIQRALDNCRKGGLATIASLIVGYPGETDATLENTFRVVSETPPDFHFLATFSVRVPGVPVLSEKSRSLHGLRVLPNRWAMAPYWKHGTMGCDAVGGRVRALEGRLMSESVSLNAALFHAWTDGYRTGMRDRWLAYQKLAWDRMRTRRRVFDHLHAWIDRRLAADLALCLPDGERAEGSP